MVKGLIDLEVGSNEKSPASSTASGQSAKGQADAVKENDLDWREFLTKEGLNEWDLS